MISTTALILRELHFLSWGFVGADDEDDWNEEYTEDNEDNNVDKNDENNVNEDNEDGNDDVDDPIFLLPFPGDSSSSPFTACRLHS